MTAVVVSCTQTIFPFFVFSFSSKSLNGVVLLQDLMVYLAIGGVEKQILRDVDFQHLFLGSVFKQTDPGRIDVDQFTRSGAEENYIHAFFKQGTILVFRQTQRLFELLAFNHFRKNICHGLQKTDFFQGKPRTVAE